MPRRRSLLALLAAALASPAFAQQEARRPRRSQDPDVVFPTAGPRGWARQVPQLRIGLLGGENEADRLGRFDGYRKLLEETFRVPARLYPASDYAGVIQAFGAKQIDLSTMSPSAYAGAWLDTNGGVEPIVTTEEADGSISYVSVMLVRADSGITDLAEMRGRSIAWSDPNSASGYLIPRFALLQVAQTLGRQREPLADLHHELDDAPAVLAGVAVVRLDDVPEHIGGAPVGTRQLGERADTLAPLAAEDAEDAEQRDQRERRPRMIGGVQADDEADRCERGVDRDDLAQLAELLQQVRASQRRLPQRRYQDVDGGLGEQRRQKQRDAGVGAVVRAGEDQGERRAERDPAVAQRDPQPRGGAPPSGEVRDPRQHEGEADGERHVVSRRDDEQRNECELRRRDEAARDVELDPSGDGIRERRAGDREPRGPARVGTPRKRHGDEEEDTAEQTLDDGFAVSQPSRAQAKLVDDALLRSVVRVQGHHILDRHPRMTFEGVARRMFHRDPRTALPMH
jgi:phosphate/phosphite/phosphonate ABC transporter binding protein